MSFLFHFCQNNAVGGENKILQRHFYFYLDFQKNRVGSPENQKKNSLLTEPKKIVMIVIRCQHKHALRVSGKSM